MIKVKCLAGYTRNGQWWQTCNLRPYIPDDGKKGRGHVQMDGALVPSGGVFLGTMAEVFFRSDLPENGSKTNRCIQRITNGHMAQPWTGPFIAFRRTHLKAGVLHSLQMSSLYLFSRLVTCPLYSLFDRACLVVDMFTSRLLIAVVLPLIVATVCGFFRLGPDG